MVSRKDLLAGAAAVPEVKLTKPDAEPLRVTAALAWYRREDYPRVLEMMADRSEMHDTYDEWLRDSEGVEQHLVSEGQAVTRVIIDPGKFRSWCEQHSLKPVGKARSRFAAEVGYEIGNDEVK